jgi:hypothetical protein
MGNSDNLAGEAADLSLFGCLVAYNSVKNAAKHTDISKLLVPLHA